MVEEEVMLAIIGEEEEEGLDRRVVEIIHSVTRMRGKTISLSIKRQQYGTR